MTARDITMSTRGITPLVLALMLATIVAPATSVRLISKLIKDGDALKARKMCEIPNFCGDKFRNKRILSYSGHLTVDERFGNHLFFWYFPSPEDVLDIKPLLVWLNGGPGRSSMRGAVLSNGPVEINKDATGDDCLLQPREKGSWTEHFNILYIDNPVGTGYSYSTSGKKGLATTRFNYTKGLIYALDQFYNLFDFSNRPLYLGGNGYGGKYVLSLANAIHLSSARRSHMKVTGLILSSPLFAPALMTKRAAHFANVLGYMGIKEKRHFYEDLRPILGKVRKNQSIKLPRQSFLNYLVPLASDPLNLYNFVKRTDFAEQDKQMTKVMRSPSLVEAHDVKGRRFRPNRKQVFGYLMQDYLRSNRKLLNNSLQRYKVLVYNGAYDFMINSYMIDEAMIDIYPLLAQVRRTTWFGPKDSAGHRDVFGFLSHAGKLCRIIVHNAGHDASLDRPDVVSYIIGAFVVRGCVKPDDPRREEEGEEEWG